MSDQFVPDALSAPSNPMRDGMFNNKITTVEGFVGDFFPEDNISFIDTKPVLDPFNNRLFIKVDS